MVFTREEMLQALAANADQVIAGGVCLYHMALSGPTEREIRAEMRSSAEHAMWLVRNVPVKG